MKAVRVVFTSPTRLPRFVMEAYICLDDKFTTVLVEEEIREGKRYEVVERDDGGYRGDDFCDFLLSCVYFSKLVGFAYHFKDRKLHIHNFKEFMKSRCPFAVLCRNLFEVVLFFRYDEDFYAAISKMNTSVMNSFELLTTESDMRKYFWWNIEPREY